jgi:O-methyltransferase
MFPITEKLITQYPVPICSSSPSKMTHVLKELEYILLNNIEGQVVELGIESGQTSIYIQRMLKEYKSDRQFHVYDSFIGIPKPSKVDVENVEQPFTEGTCSSSKEVFINRFKSENVELPIIHTGFFADIPDEEYPNKIAFAFFDGDLYSSIFDSFNKTYNKLVCGARVVIDDFKWCRTPGVEVAVKEFLKDKPEKEIFLPDYRNPTEGGGCLIIKQEIKKLTIPSLEQKSEKILLLYTSHRQIQEVHIQSLLFKKFPEKYTNISQVDILFYCNSTQIAKEDLIKYLNMFPNKNKKLIYTNKNIGYSWGGHEAISETFDIWKEYDVCLHLHPDVFILRDDILFDIIKNNKGDFIGTHNLDPKTTPHFAFDFFMFRPRQIFNSHKNVFNFFDLYLTEKRNYEMPEKLLLDLTTKYKFNTSVVKRYDNNHWEPRRPDNIGLYHEHDLQKIIRILNNNIVPVFINIERFRERKEHCIKLFTALFSPQFYLFNGVDGKNINIYSTEKKNTYLIEYNNQTYTHNSEHRQKTMSYGEFGCFLSHVKLLNYMIENNYKAMFICEDDILPRFKDVNVFNTYMKNLPPLENFDIALFHHKSENFKNEIVKVNDFYDGFKPGNKPNFNMALSYVISLNGAIKFLNRNKDNINMPFDDQLSRLDLNIIYSKEALFEQNVSVLKSSIWNIYKDDEKDDNVKWDKEIVKDIVKNDVMEYTIV